MQQVMFVKRLCPAVCAVALVAVGCEDEPEEGVDRRPNVSGDVTVVGTGNDDEADTTDRPSVTASAKEPARAATSGPFGESRWPETPEEWRGQVLREERDILQFRQHYFNTSAPEDPVGKIVYVADFLARSDLPAARRLAAQFARVLAAHQPLLDMHKQELSDNLLRQLKQPPAPDPQEHVSDEQLFEIKLADSLTRRVARDIVEYDDTAAADELKFRVDLLLSVAEHSPSSEDRLDAAGILRLMVRRPVRYSLNKTERFATVEPPVARQALFAAVDYMLDPARIPMTRDTGEALLRFFLSEIDVTHYIDEVCRAEGLELDETGPRAEQIFEEWNATLTAQAKLQNAAQDVPAKHMKKVLDALTGIRDKFLPLLKKAYMKKLSERISRAKMLPRIQKMLEEFHAAVNRQDKEAIWKFMTPETAAKTKVPDPVRAYLRPSSGLADATSVKVVSVRLNPWVTPVPGKAFDISLSLEYRNPAGETRRRRVSRSLVELDGKLYIAVRY